VLSGRRASVDRLAWVRGLPFYYGWIVVFLGAFSMFATTPGQSDSFSLFMDSFVSDFGWSRTVVSSLYSGATLLAGFLMFFVGRLVDRLGTKAVAMAAALTLGGACLLLSLSISPFMLFAGFFLARLTGKGALELSAGTLAPQWFIRRRALAIMLVGLGSAIGGALFPLLNSWLITTFGWRAAYRFLAGGLWLVYVPVIWAFLINRPEDVGMRPDHAAASSLPGKMGSAMVDETMEEPSFQQTQAIRTSAFWILTYAIFQSSLVGTGVTLHFVSILGAHGFSMTFAAIIMGIKPLIALSAAVLAGVLLDRIRQHHWVLAVACLLQVTSFVILAFLQNAAMAYLFSVVGGIGSGLLMLSYRLLKANLFGRRYLGGILGVTAAFNVIGAAIGPILFGAAYDGLQGYQEIILLSSALPLLGGILGFVIRKPSLPAAPEAPSS
jgi:MFS family permease